MIILKHRNYAKQLEELKKRNGKKEEPPTNVVENQWS
jgi:hypothetical protein